jgi:hypothetical protein
MDEAMPRLAVVAGGGDIGVDQKQTVTIELRESSGQRLNRDATVLLEATGGYLPKQRVELTGGQGSFPVIAFGLEAGDAFRIKAGFRNYSGMLDIPFTVV